MIEPYFGQYLRQLRRQHNLTQIELGAPQFSKSYVSAVERNKIIPSQNALKHFAEKLQQTIDALTSILQQTEEKTSPHSSPDEYDQEVFPLVDVILKGDHKISQGMFTQLQQLSLLSPTDTLWQKRRGRFLFLNGLIQQQDKDFSAARISFEQALAFVTPDYYPFIYNALGTNYVFVQDYLYALHYHQRAFEYLKEHEPENVGVLQQSAYNCGDDSRALGYHVKARFYFEEATQYAQATNTIVNTGNLYLRLGYCTYALLFQRSGTILNRKKLEAEEIERTFLQVIDYLIHSRTLYQISGNKLEEIHAYVTQIMVLVDWDFWKFDMFLLYQFHQNSAADLAENTPLPDDTYKQCQKLLLKLLEQYKNISTPPVEIYSITVTAITYLIRIAVQDAMHSRVSGSMVKSTQARLRAIVLSEYLLVFLTSKIFSWECIEQCVHVSSNNQPDQTQTIISLETLEKVKTLLSHNAHILTDVCFALGTLAEEIALVTDEGEDANERFYVADQMFQQALDSALFEAPGDERDPSYTVRVYQRYIAVLERRMLFVSESKNAFVQLLLTVNTILMTLPSSMFPLFFEHIPS